MASKNLPPNGPPVLTSWIQRLSTRKQVHTEPVPQKSPIFQLPDEIFIEVFSNFPTFRLEQAYYRVDQHDWLVIDARYFSSDYGTRHRVLLAFTQLCCSTRQKFLPWLWEHVQSLCVHSPGMEEWECRQIAKKMFRRQSKTLVAKPSLAVHVKTFSVHMSRSNAPDLVKLLPLLPNLDTLEVLTEDYVEPSLVLSFKLVKLPRVRTLVVDAQAHYLMKCCTHVKRVVIHRRGFDVTYLESIPFIADSLVYLAVCPPVPEIIQDLARLCPNLEELGFIQPYCFQVPECVDPVRDFKKLRLLELVLPCRLDFYSSDPRPVWEARIRERAVTVLGNIRGHTKSLKIISVGGFPRWENIHDVEAQRIEVP